jgi:hypothetical protein
MLKYLAKFASDILPSVAATIIGAYIVNHYITAKPAAPAPAAVSSTAPDSKPADTPTDVANIPSTSVKGKGASDKGVADKATSDKATSDKAVADKGISDKAAFDKAAAEKPQEKAKEKTAEKAPEKAQDKSEDKPAETASISTDIHRHPVLPREKTAIRTIPLTAPAVQPAASAAAPANPPAAVEAAVKPDEQRDANDLARAAIERLRENSPHSQDAARAPASQATASVQPLPPPVMVAAPAGDTFAPGANGQMQQYPSDAQANDPNRPVPPADIPQPLEVRTDSNGVPPLQQHNKNVAEDMLSAAKSVFHAVLPQ